MRRSCDCIPGHLIRSCWYHRRCHQPFQAQNRWCPLFLRSCQCPLCGSWENDLTHRQLLSAAWVILYSHFYWGGDLAGRTIANKGWERGSHVPGKLQKICSGCSVPVVKNCVFNAMCKGTARTSTLEILMSKRWLGLCAPSSAAGRWCEYQQWKDLGRPAEQKVKRVPRQLQRGPMERWVGGGVVVGGGSGLRPNG